MTNEMNKKIARKINWLMEIALEKSGAMNGNGFILFGLVMFAYLLFQYMVTGAESAMQQTVKEQFFTQALICQMIQGVGVVIRLLNKNQNVDD